MSANILVVTDKIGYLTKEKLRLRNVISPNERAFYFCSTIEKGYELPVDLENNFVKIKDYLDKFEKRYDEFLGLTEKLYYELCDKFNSVYAKMLKNFTIYDMSQYDICVLLMEFMRIYLFLKYIITFNKIEKIIILRPKTNQANYKYGVYGFLGDFPIDSSIALVLAKELKLEIVFLESDNVSKKKMFFKPCGALVKNFLRYVCYFYLKIKDIFTIRHDKLRPNIILFGSLTHLLSTAKAISDLRKINLFSYHPTPLIKFVKLFRQNNIRHISRGFISLRGYFNYLYNTIKANRIAKEYESRCTDGAYNISEFLANIFNNYCRYNIPDFLRKCRIYEELFYKIKPRAVLLDENVSALRKPFEFIAKKKNIAVFTVNHGMQAKCYPVCLNKSITDASYLFIGGQCLQDIYAGYYQANPGRLIITGTPRYDDIFRLKHSIPKNKTAKICFAPTSFLKRGTTYNYLDYIINFKENLNTVVECVRQHKLPTVVKFHPGDPHEDLIRNAFMKAGLQAEYITDEMTSIEVLKDIDLLVTCWSSIALEGFLYGKPVIIMNNFIGFPARINFTKDGIALFAENPKMLKNLIDDFCNNRLPNPANNQNARDISFRYEAYQDDLASSRVADFIIKTALS